MRHPNEVRLYTPGVDVPSPSGCPIAGEYTGVIPDAQELCARLTSDCHRPQHMHYTVHACANATEVYEGESWTRGGE